jgi:monofunctional glycosyltransferase
MSLAAAGYFLWAGARFIEREFPKVEVLSSQYPAVIYKGTGTPPEIRLRLKRPEGWTRLGNISKAVVGAIVVSEDWAFFQHNGYDAKQIREALKVDIEKGRFKRGASTITQQVVRNVFLSKDKNLWRKLKELVLAVRLEESVGKLRILETYLNIAEWGEGIFGIREAAQWYFSKDPSELTAKEGAFLAMLLPSPKKYSVSFRNQALTRYARSTIEVILLKMTKASYITEDERQAELVRPLSFELSYGSEI